MRDVIDAITRWHAEGRRLALATVIGVHGSAPRDEGAKMVISERGDIIGSVSGGCVEAAVAEEAQRVLADGAPTVVRYGINRNMMWDVGLSCGGTIEVLIEPLDAVKGALEQTIVDLMRARRPFAVCTVISVGAHNAAKLVVRLDSGEVVARTGGPEPARFERAIAAEAQSRDATARSGVAELDDRKVYVDITLPEPRLIIVGAVHVAMALCDMASMAGFEVWVIDPRPALNNRERFPRAHERLVAWPEESLPSLAIDENTYVAVLTHDDKFDDPTLEHVLRTPARYIGAIGSKTTQRLRRERLQERGISVSDVARIHGPIGLDIGAQSPHEIAVAILSEMIAVRHQRSGSPLRDSSATRIHA